MKDTDKKPKIIAIVGPTASGKTNISIEVAKRLNGEIISADSRLVYKDFDIGTAKPAVEEMSVIPHYLINIEFPSKTYTVNRYKKDADKKIKEILFNKKIPIVVGGTGFYVKALLEGLNIPDVEPDEKFRKEMIDFVKEKGREALYQKLCETDFVMAEKLYPQDSFRIIRALEVQRATGKRMSEIQTLSVPEYNVFYFGLNAENRDFLYERINHRVRIMLKQGLLAEVEELIKRYGRTNSLLKTLGYKEICEYIDGIYSLEEATAKIQQNTRKFAKRQLTWFRANKKINWFFIDTMSSNEIIDRIIEDYSKT